MKEVLVYSTKTWPHCQPAKDYLASKGVSFVEKDIQADPAARKELMGLGSMSVPTIKIGEEVIVGFDQGRIDKLLGL